MLNKILFATDVSLESRRAFSYVAKVARKTGASVIGAYLVDLPRRSTGETGWKEQQQRAESRREYSDRLEGFFSHPDLKGIDLEIWIPKELPKDAIGRAVEIADADVSMITKQHRSRLESFFLGSDTEKLLGLARRPVWVVPSNGSYSLEWSPIVCAVDFHSSSERALNFAIQLARDCGSKVTAIHVLDGSVPEDLQGLLRDRREQLKDMLSVFDAPSGSEAMVMHGHLKDVLLDRARAQGWDLLVLGIKGAQSSDNSQTLGSSANQLIRSASFPVLIHP
jgi:nucleotide-binding universal stress UspA family protein